MCGIAAFLRAGLSLCLFIGNYEESCVIHFTRGLWLPPSLLFHSCLLFLQITSGTKWIWGLMPSKNPVNKEWNERDELSVT